MSLLDSYIAIWLTNRRYSKFCVLTPKPPPIAEFATEFLSAENLPKIFGLAEFTAKFFLPKIRQKNMNIRILKWNQHYNKWLACYLKWNILVISKLLVITDGCRFCNSKETDNNKYITQWFQFRFNGQICSIIRLIRLSAKFFSSHLYFFRLQFWVCCGPKCLDWKFTIKLTI